MTATIAPSEAPVTAPVSIHRAYRFELVKLVAQWRVRLLILACWIGPAIAVALVSQQTSLPADTLFGRWMHATGWAGALVVLGFAGNWVLPLMTSVVAGEVTYGILPIAGVLVVSAGLLAAATGATGSGITLDKVRQSLATDFANIYPLQYSELYHGTVTEAQLRVTASCTKGGGLSGPEGPGDDWRCLVYWHIPGVNDATAQAVYQLDVNPNGRYVADGDGPTQVNGYFIVHTPYGDASNPLWQFDGNVDLLSARG